MAIYLIVYQEKVPMGASGKHGDGGARSDPSHGFICVSPARHRISPSTVLDVRRFVAIMLKEEDNAVFQDATNEDVRLENLGYEQGESNWKIIGSGVGADICLKSSSGHLAYLV